MCAMGFARAALAVALVGGLRVAALAQDVPPDEADADHDEEVVRLDAEGRRQYGVEVAEAAPGTLRVTLRLPGEVVVDPDRVAHVVPRVPGVARQVRAGLGDVVAAGETLAVLDSRELSEMKSQYLVTRERAVLAQTTFEREERLWREQVSSEREYLAARQALAEARIEARAAEQSLHAIGLGDADLEGLAFREDASFIRYAITAPLGGAIVQKHITLGEFVRDEESAFMVADLSRVWVELTVYQQDLPRVRVGQPVVIADTQTGTRVEGRVAYVTPLLGQETRTATARVVVANDGVWRPGLFVEGQVVVDERRVGVLVPKEALQTFEGRTVVFALMQEAFVPRPVELGLEDDAHVEVLSGLAPGQAYAAAGSFTLKAQLEKSGFADGHGH